jgi:hypothetical protein
MYFSHLDAEIQGLKLLAQTRGEKEKKEGHSLFKIWVVEK